MKKTAMTHAYLRFKNRFSIHLICFREYFLVLCFISLTADNTTANLQITSIIALTLHNIFH